MMYINLLKTKTMERHDHELKQREDQIIHVTNEASLVTSFELEIHFDYKGTEYGAYCTYEVEGRGVCDIGIYELNSRNDIHPPLFDELYDQVEVYFQEDYNIKANDLQW